MGLGKPTLLQAISKAFSSLNRPPIAGVDLIIKNEKMNLSHPLIRRTIDNLRRSLN